VQDEEGAPMKRQQDDGKGRSRTGSRDGESGKANKKKKNRKRMHLKGCVSGFGTRESKKEV
jgi:hypothetical protein